MMPRSPFNVLLAALLLTPVCLLAEADDWQAPAWRESEVVFPAVPAREKMHPFFVSAASTHRYFVDPGSLAVGDDGVVRYVLLVETEAGGRNMSFEGMRCATREKRLYASLRRDGEWAPARRVSWERIRDIAPARQHAALFLEYFCPGGVIVRNADEARRALRQGGHPSVKLW